MSLVQPISAPATASLLERAGAPAEPPSGVSVTERDIVFDCPHCRGELVVDQAGAGMTLACTHCEKGVTVPHQMSVTRRIIRPVIPAAPRTLQSPRTQSTTQPPQTFGFDKQSPTQISQRIEELRLQLTENRSQGTEMRGHVNRATMELHRLQLKLQKLVERQTAIETELFAAKAALSQRT